jgi:choice-of-anchor A domain-containing protein
MTATHNWILPPLAVMLVSLLPASTFAAMVDLGPAGDFNVYVLGNNTQFGTDSHGPIAVGGDALFGGYNIASQMNSSSDSLVVGGNFSNTSNQIQGKMYVGGSSNWATPTINGNVYVNGNATFTGGGSVNGTMTVGGTYSAPGYFPTPTVATTPLPIDFAATNAYLIEMADNLTSLAPTDATSINGFGYVTLNVTSGGSFASFDLTTAQLAGATGQGLTINAPAGTTVVVNVDGPMATMSSFGIFLNGGVDEHEVLYNFADATSLAISGIGIRGTVLAPRANVAFNSGNIDGTMIAGNLSGQGESHLFLFNGHLPPPSNIPEPSSVMLVALGALAAWGARGRISGRV